MNKEFNFFRKKLGMYHIKYVLLVIGIIFKSMFKATVELMYGIISFLGLGALLFYLKEKGQLFTETAFMSSIGIVSNILMFIKEHLNLFWWILFLLILYDNWYRIRELRWEKQK